MKIHRDRPSDAVRAAKDSPPLCGRPGKAASLILDLTETRRTSGSMDQPTAEKALRELEPLIGEWLGVGEMPIEPPMTLSVDATVERMGQFIVFHSRGG